MTTATPSILTKKQVKAFRHDYTRGGKPETIIVKVRYDDECGNGHNSFAITADIYTTDRQPGEETIKHAEGRTLWLNSCGCQHDEVAKRFPNLAPLVKWHLFDSTGPMHYIANTVYHADEHGPTHAWVYFTGQNDPLEIGEAKERLLGYEKAADARKAEGQPGYRVNWDEKTVKTRNLDHARSTAVWPEATDEDLTAPGLKDRLEARLPQLLVDFRAAVESLGFTY